MVVEDLFGGVVVILSADILEILMMVLINLMMLKEITMMSCALAADPSW